MLYVVSTPIGNLGDMTYRAVETLKNVSAILCEDTRVSKKLLDHFGIQNKLISYHKYSEMEKLDEILSRLSGGEDIAIISDAGTPLISDPGNILVSACRDAGIEVTAVPGCCAVINGLVLSGFDLSSFTFCGFLPKQKRAAHIEKYKNLQGTLVFYVTKNSVSDDVEEIYKVLGDRRAFLVREMTKMFEEGISFKLSEKLPQMKGEMVLVCEGASGEVDLSDLPAGEHLMMYIKSGMDKKEAIKRVAKERGVPKNEIYMLLSSD